MTINCGLENQAENSILEHCAACDSDGSKCLKKAVDDAGLVFEDNREDTGYIGINQGGMFVGQISDCGDVAFIDYDRGVTFYFNKAELLAIAEKMG